MKLLVFSMANNTQNTTSSTLPNENKVTIDGFTEKGSKTLADMLSSSVEEIVSSRIEEHNENTTNAIKDALTNSATNMSNSLKGALNDVNGAELAESIYSSMNNALLDSGIVGSLNLLVEQGNKVIESNNATQKNVLDKMYATPEDRYNAIQQTVSQQLAESSPVNGKEVSDFMSKQNELAELETRVLTEYIKDVDEKDESNEKDIDTSLPKEVETPKEVVVKHEPIETKVTVENISDAEKSEEKEVDRPDNISLIKDLIADGVSAIHDIVDNKKELEPNQPIKQVVIHETIQPKIESLKAEPVQQEKIKDVDKEDNDSKAETAISEIDISKKSMTELMDNLSGLIHEHKEVNPPVVPDSKIEVPEIKSTEKDESEQPPAEIKSADNIDTDKFEKLTGMFTELMMGLKNTDLIINEKKDVEHIEPHETQEKFTDVANMHSPVDNDRIIKLDEHNVTVNLPEIKPEIVEVHSDKLTLAEKQVEKQTIKEETENKSEPEPKPEKRQDTYFNFDFLKDALETKEPVRTEEETRMIQVESAEREMDHTEHTVETQSNGMTVDDMNYLAQAIAKAIVHEMATSSEIQATDKAIIDAFGEKLNNIRG